MKTSKALVSQKLFLDPKFKGLSALIIGFATLSLASPSYADYKVYPGSGCLPNVGKDSNVLNRDIQGIINVGFETAFVNCPIVRDRLEASPLLDPGIKVVSRNGTNLSCTFYSMDQNGRALDSVYKSTSSTVPTSLIFSGRKLQNQAAGYYFIQCILPPGGRVIQYSIGEAGETGVP